MTRGMMSSAITLLLFMLSAIMICSFTIHPVDAADSKVVVLGLSNFTETVKPDEAWLVEFYAPWCGHCKRLEPTWNELAEKVAADKELSHVRIAKIDATQAEMLATLLNVQGYPTLLHFYGNGIRKFDDSRTTTVLLRFLRTGWKHVDPVPFPAAGIEDAENDGDDDSVVEDNGDVVVLSQQNFTEALSSGDWLVEFYAPWCGYCKQLAPVYNQLATSLKGKTNVAKIDATQNQFLAILFDIRGYPTIKFFKNGSVYDYDGERNKQAFIDFVSSDYKKAAASSVPSHLYVTGLQYIYDVYLYIEPIAKLSQEYLGTTFFLVAILSLLLGFLLGRITAPNTRYLIVNDEEYKRRVDLAKRQYQQQQPQQQPVAKQDKKQQKEGAKKEEKKKNK